MILRLYSPHQGNFGNPITAGSVVTLFFSAIIFSTGYVGATEIADGIAMGSFTAMLSERLVGTWFGFICISIIGAFFHQAFRPVFPGFGGGLGFQVSEVERHLGA